ncbi:hypothetical protein ILUMI_05771 [Ignelater luminosus]|uniref:Glutathione S-transferase n=1 Tax=Ignelater luminosus TaxID=2038154 RepID=A0A8K0DH14_IGNLU|nr:hypothetical protein ILUMI_05771 [Ignelater luminosus]
MINNSLKLFFSQYSPPARGVYLVSKALNLDLTLVDVNILSKAYLIPELVSINPQHTIPTLQDGSFVVWDSHAIAGYLVGMYGKDDMLYPKDPKKRATIDQRLHFDTENLFPKVVEAIYPILFRGKTAVPSNLRESIKRSYGFLEKFLKKKVWLAGNDLTIADLCCVSSIKKCKQLPYYQEANQRGLDMLGSKIQERLVETYVRNLTIKND